MRCTYQNKAIINNWFKSGRARSFSWESPTRTQFFLFFLSFVLFLFFFSFLWWESGSWIVARCAAAPATVKLLTVSTWRWEWRGVSGRKFHDCLHSVKKNTTGERRVGGGGGGGGWGGSGFGAVGREAEGETGRWRRRVKFIRQCDFPFRPRWGSRPYCSECLEAGTTWTLLHFPLSSNRVLLQRSSPGGHSGAELVAE